MILKIGLKMVGLLFKLASILYVVSVALIIAVLITPIYVVFYIFKAIDLEEIKLLYKEWFRNEEN